VIRRAVEITAEAEQSLMDIDGELSKFVEEQAVVQRRIQEPRFSSQRSVAHLELHK